MDLHFGIDVPLTVAKRSYAGLLSSLMWLVSPVRCTSAAIKLGMCASASAA